jgi:hypothetical protein
LLKSFGIETLIDLPGVGENLLDQTYTLIDFIAKGHVKTLGASVRSLRALLRLIHITLLIDEMRINATFAQEQIALQYVVSHVLSSTPWADDSGISPSLETQTGILTYDTAATGSVPLQAVLSKEEIELLSSLMPLKVGSDLSPLQAVQYWLLRKWFDEGEIGWAEFLLLSAGGATGAPSPDTSYATPIVFHLVRVPLVENENIRLTLSSISIAASVGTWLGCKAARFSHGKGSVLTLTQPEKHINSSDPLSPPVVDPKYFGHKFG